MASEPSNNLRTSNFNSTFIYSKPNSSISRSVDGLKYNNKSRGENLIDPRFQPHNATINATIANGTPFSDPLLPETFDCNQLDSQGEIHTSKQASLFVLSQNPTSTFNRTTKPEYSNRENSTNNDICKPCISRDPPIEQINADLPASFLNSDSGASYDSFRPRDNKFYPGSEQLADIPYSDSAPNLPNSLYQQNANDSCISLDSNADLEKLQDEFRNVIRMASNDKYCIVPFIPIVEGHAELSPEEDHLAVFCSKSLPDTSISSSSHASISSPPHRGSQYVRSKKNIILTEPSSAQVFFW